MKLICNRRHADVTMSNKGKNVSGTNNIKIVLVLVWILLSFAVISSFLCFLLIQIFFFRSGHLTHWFIVVFCCIFQSVFFYEIPFHMRIDLVQCHGPFSRPAILYQNKRFTPLAHIFLEITSRGLNQLRHLMKHTHSKNSWFMHICYMHVYLLIYFIYLFIYLFI